MKRIIIITSLLLLFALPLVVTGASRPAPAAANFQLQFNFGLAYSPLGQDLPGESGDSKHKGEIEVLSIVSIDRVNGIVTARDLRTGETFKFEVDSRSLLKTMRVGQKVWKQAGGSKVGVLDGKPCCDIVGKRNASPGRSTASSTANASSGATIDGKTLILKKGYEASIDPKNRGVVRIRDVGLPVRGATEYGCRCDPDEDTVSKDDTCAFYIRGDKISCEGPTCKDCDISETGTKLGTDKPQDEASPGVSTSPATATSGGRTDPGRTLVSSRVPWEIKPSADMKGATGQIVIQFPGMEQGENNFTAIFEIGGKDRISPASYGNNKFPLLEGEYDVEINSARVTRVPVTRGMDTRIHIGTISFKVPSNVSVEVYDVTQKKRLCLAYGPMKCGVPSGEYYVKVGGSSKKVTLADGQVIDF